MKNHIIIIVSFLVFVTCQLEAQEKKVSRAIAVTFNNEGENNIIEWTTEREINTNYFLIESSCDNQHFKTIARVKAAGYSLTGKNYELESTLFDGASFYYRIVLVSMEGEREYSVVVSKDHGITEEQQLVKNK